MRLFRGQGEGGLAFFSFILVYVFYIETTKELALFIYVPYRNPVPNERYKSVITVLDCLYILNVLSFTIVVVLYSFHCYHCQVHAYYTYIEIHKLFYKYDRSYNKLKTVFLALNKKHYLLFETKTDVLLTFVCKGYSYNPMR